MAEKKKKVLIVEDDDSLQKLLAKSLSVDYEVFSTGNGNDAITICGDHRIDLIILDIHIEGLEAPQVCSNLRSYPKYGNPKIIIITGMECNAGTKNAWKNMYQVDGFLKKPFMVSDLMSYTESLFDPSKDFDDSIFE